MSDDKRFRIYTRTGDSGTSSLYTGQRLAKDCSFFEALGDVDELNSAVGMAREFVLGISDTLADQLAEIQSRLLDVGSAVATPSDPVNSAGVKVKRTRFDPAHSTSLEVNMDKLDEVLPPLRNFILPSGGKAASALHIARTVCRRAERSVVALARSTTSGDSLASTTSRMNIHSSGGGTQTTAAEGNASSIQGSGEETAQASNNGDEKSQGGAADADAARMGIPPNSVVDFAVVVYINRLSDYLFTAARYMAHTEGRTEVTYQKGVSA
ncbi:cobalamin adenosyltransferase-domain-containing protein [Dunaliella salina]|uniref:Cobalamin adenosyltransferase-domain-containing protein n=1 Tax=Dunaliella salina TaxID=3046 RepID=A0ABQ7FZB8_DUNSA|nr:cobalamin adenosyltransferase-domain-containing protein [Dunaliella salina]|eukprot:KAF5827702.1 cobalamin adenosyltransferase-domain-containing protein [Dunaliella salina]